MHQHGADRTLTPLSRFYLFQNACPGRLIRFNEALGAEKWVGIGFLGYPEGVPEAFLGCTEQPSRLKRSISRRPVTIWFQSATVWVSSSSSHHLIFPALQANER